MELGIYIHIPFCVKKCDYCDFISYPIKTVVPALRFPEFRDGEGWKRTPILEICEIIGGGTPSSIKPELIQKIINKIYEIANISIEKEKTEITIEVNPGTTNKNNLQMYRNCGINRLSIGLQSTDDIILKEIGRIHNYEQFLDTL